MKKYFLIILVVIVGVSLTSFVSAEEFEEIGIVARSKPDESLFEKALEYCQYFGFTNPEEVGGLSWYAINTKKRDASIVNWEQKKIAEQLSCNDINNIDDNGEFEFYDQVTLGRKNPITLQIYGICQGMGLDVPEPGMGQFTCRGWVYDAPDGYFGGILTENGLTGEIEGYNETSIVVLRIFRE